MQEQLSKLGFHPDPFGPSICRYKIGDVPIDIIPSSDSPIGQSNRWYKVGMDNLIVTEVHGQDIQILPAPCFLATKFEAFNGRGKDYRTSHDMEDIIYVIDNRTTIVDEIETAQMEIRDFIQSELKKIVENGLLDEMLICHIHPLMLADRMPLVQGKIEEILNL